MPELLITEARNIYAQQKHNKRLTFILLSSFIIFIALIGGGIDYYLNNNIVLKIILLPFLILMFVSGLWSLKNNSIEYLWSEPKAFNEEEDADPTYANYQIKIILYTCLIVMLVPVIIEPKLLEQMISKLSISPLLQILPVTTVFLVIVGIIVIASSIKWGTSAILWSVRAEHINNNLIFFQESIDLKNIVKEISLAAGISPPSVFIVMDKDPNAFAVGTSSSKSIIVVTSGLVYALNREEMQGVIAHEISHIKNADTQLRTIVTVLFGAILLLAEWMKKGGLLGSMAGGKIPGPSLILRLAFFIGWILLALFAPIISKIVAMAISRNREYLADACAAELTRNPKGLAKALAKLESFVDATHSFKKNVAHMCIVDPQDSWLNKKEGKLSNLFATHPPLKNRITFLNAMAYNYK